jgi:hypothetical protein
MKLGTYITAPEPIWICTYYLELIQSFKGLKRLPVYNMPTEINWKAQDRMLAGRPEFDSRQGLNFCIRHHCKLALEPSQLRTL